MLQERCSESSSPKSASSKSSNSKTGYLCVVEPHKGKFYPKRKLDDEKGSKKMKAFGTASPTAWEAANKLAEFLAAPYELPTAPQRKVRT